jgi:CubicO group peptidase (beta-lactamase class C family)
VLLFAPAFAQIRPLDPAAIERVALDELKSTNTPGAAVAVISGDRVIFTHGYGTSDVETGAPVSPDMLFRLGSTTKMFTAAALVGLAVEGKVDLDAPVGSYIKGLDPAIARLTANQLLSHTSGLHDEAPMFGSHDESALGDGIHKWKADFLFAPAGRIYSYSNPGFWLAGYLAETVAGKAYADVVGERIFKPLGMAHSTLRPTMAMTWPLAQGHEVHDGKPQVIHPAADNASGWPAGSIFSSANELAKFVIAFMNGSAALSQKVVSLMSSPHAKIPGSEATYGYGLQLAVERGVRWVEHGGSRAGYGSNIRMAPDRKFAVIITANRSGSGMPKLADAISEMALNLEPAVKKNVPTHPLTPAEIQRYAGTYRNGETVIHLVADNGALRSGRDRFDRAGEGFLQGATKLVVQDEYLFTGGRSYRRAE